MVPEWLIMLNTTRRPDASRRACHFRRRGLCGLRTIEKQKEGAADRKSFVEAGSGARRIPTQPAGGVDGCWAVGQMSQVDLRSWPCLRGHLPNFLADEEKTSWFIVNI